MRMIEHYVYAKTVRSLIRDIDEFRPGHIVFLIAPSGAGKTTARYAALREIFGRPEYWGTGRIPVIDTHALLPSNAYYSSMDMARTLADQLNAPDLRWLTHGVERLSANTAAIVTEVDRARELWVTGARRRLSEAEYWEIVGYQTHVRGCKVICIDHATALLRNRANLQPAQHIEHLVSLAEKWDIMFVMTGVHRVEKLWEIHSELRRRIHKVWMPPYSHARKEDEMHWSRLIKNVSGRYRLLRQDVAYNLRDEILASTGGLLGEVLQLLDRANGRALADGREAISAGDIGASYYSERDLAALWSDIAEFEEAREVGDVSSRARAIRAAWGNAGKAVAKRSANDA